MKNDDVLAACCVVLPCCGWDDWTAVWDRRARRSSAKGLERRSEDRAIRDRRSRSNRWGARSKRGNGQRLIQNDCACVWVGGRCGTVIHCERAAQASPAPQAADIQASEARARQFLAVKSCASRAREVVCRARSGRFDIKDASCEMRGCPGSGFGLDKGWEARRSRRKLRARSLRREARSRFWLISASVRAGLPTPSAHGPPRPCCS